MANNSHKFMNQKVVILATASASLLALAVTTNSGQAAPESFHPSFNTENLGDMIIGKTTGEENPIFRHLNCSCATCTQSLNSLLN
ncbi:hypothetical protein myaer87_21640 [Microcystis aeruginosa NIES-87]|nr:hypothetical protein myaer87_21640 [Microcystis aeruginosa NIES-87]